MRKLAVASLAFSAGIFAANYLIPRAWLIVPAVILAAAAAGLALLREKWLRPAAAALLFASLGMLEFHTYYYLTAEKAEAVSGSTVTVTARLTAYPEIYDGYCRAEAVITGGDAPKLKVLIYDNGMSLKNARAGQTVALSGKISAANTVYGESYDGYYARNIFLKLSNRGEISVSGGFDIRSLPAHIGHYISSSIDKVFPTDTAPFMKALLIGDKTDYYGDTALKASFMRAGLSHIVAISGMHVAFFVGMVQLIFGRNRSLAILSLALVWLFALATGAGVSVVRAAFMQSMLLMAPIVYRENDPITSLSATLALILLCNPFAAKSVSLQLSFAAMLGIVLFSERIIEMLTPDKGKRRSRLGLKLAAVTAMTLAANVFTAPLTAVHFGYFPVVSLVSNVLVLWAVPICFVGGMCACALSAVPMLGMAAGWLVSWLARYIVFMARLISRIPFAVVYTQTRYSVIWAVGVYAVFIIFALTKRRAWIRLGVPALISTLSLALLLVSVKRSYEDGAAFAAVNVGQGQCAVLMSGDSTVMVDCGSSSGVDAGEAAGEYLRSCGRDRIDTLIISHPHDDHANGIEMLMELMPVDTVIISESTDADRRGYEALRALAEKHGAEIISVSDDTAAHCGDIDMTLYVPRQSGDMNENGLCVRLNTGKFGALIMGDASAATERELINTRDIGTADILLVSHHGSADGCDSGFLRRLGARQAVISTGYNFYGHPEREALERLENSGYNIYRTDIDGTVEFRIG